MAARPLATNSQVSLTPLLLPLFLSSW
uniref:Uncharacterized protein n=1 Tax=Rhizophora mucronata TaxID=61149 RepID=A0A2P2NSU7_RHIMU